MAKKLIFKNTAPVVGPTQPTPFTPDQAEAAMNAIQGSNQQQPVVTGDVMEEPTPQKKMTLEQQLRQSIEDDFNQRKAMQEAEQNALMNKLKSPVQADLSPTMALIASMSGDRNLASAYKAPEMSDISKEFQQLSGNKRQLTQDRIANLKTMLENKQSANTQARLAVQNDRMDRNEHMQIVRAIKNDPVARQRLTQFQNLGNSLALIDKSEKLTPQQIHEFQQSIRSNLGIKGTSGVGEREATFLDSLGLRAEAFQQFLTGDPAEISKNDKLVNHIRDLARVERSQINSQFQDELDTASEGRASLYARRPDLNKDLEKLIKASSKRVNIENDNVAYGGSIQPKTINTSPTPVPSQGQAYAAPTQPIDHAQGAAAELARRAALKAGK